MLEKILKKVAHFSEKLFKKVSSKENASSLRSEA
jgi:hypothetical protein